MLSHAQGKRLCPSKHEPRVKRARHRTCRIKDELQAICKIILKNHGDAADHISMTIEVFRCGMPHDVGTEFQRTLEDRTGKRVVDHEKRLMLFGDGTHR